MEITNLNFEDIHTIVSAVVAIIGAIIAIKTYFHAKKTLLQPMKSAVVNKQTDILIDIAQKFGTDFSQIESKMYFEVIRLTMIDSIGEIVKLEGINEDTKSDIVGKFSLYSPEETKSLYISKGSDTPKDIEQFFQNKDKKKSIKEGMYRVDVLSYGKITSEVFGNLSNYSTHPLVPAVIQKKLDKIEENCLDILKKDLANEIEGFINTMMMKGNNQGTIYFDAIYNDFLRKNGAEKMFKTKELSYTINQEIRKYLHVDDEWK